MKKHSVDESLEDVAKFAWFALLIRAVEGLFQNRSNNVEHNTSWE